MKRNILPLMGISLGLILSVTGCGNQKDTQANLEVEPIESTTAGDAEGTVSLTLWSAEEDAELLNTLIEGFKEHYASEATIDITVEPMPEGDCKDAILANVHEGPDVFTFADDQVRALAASGVLKPIENADEIKAANVAGSVNAASLNDKLYAYPLTADNGYFMYYNKKYFSENDVATLDKMLQIAAASQKKVTMDWSSGWYLYSFWGNTGLELYLNEDGISNACNWNSTTGDITGLDVANAMQAIAKHPGFLNTTDAGLLEGAKNDSVIAGISGAWCATTLEECWGDNLGAVKLPTYTCAGKQVQMGSFTGYKLVGVNSYSHNTEWAAKLAEWLSSEESQTARFSARGQGPANINAAASPEVSASAPIKAVIAQSEYGTPQRIGNSYWLATLVFGETILSGEITNQDDMQQVLDKMVEGITSTD